MIDFKASDLDPVDSTTTELDGRLFLKALLGAVSQGHLSTKAPVYQHFRRLSPQTLDRRAPQDTFAHEFIQTNQLKNSTTMGLNKAELIESIAADAKISKADAKRALDAFVTSTTKALKKGERVALVGFGTFSITKRAARKGRNPQTGKEIKIAAKKVVKFKAGADLSSKVK